MPDPTETFPGDSGEQYDEEEFDPEEAERRITQFVTSADELPGPPVEVLAEQVATLTRGAWSELEEIMSGKGRGLLT